MGGRGRDGRGLLSRCSCVFLLLVLVYFLYCLFLFICLFVLLFLGISAHCLSMSSLYVTGKSSEPLYGKFSFQGRCCKSVSDSHAKSIAQEIR